MKMYTQAFQMVSIFEPQTEEQMYQRARLQVSNPAARE